MAAFVRDSKFRHVDVKVEKSDRIYDQLKISTTQIDGNGLIANSKFLAYIDSAAGSSQIAVLPLSSVGKNHIPISAPSYRQPLIRAHTQSVQDFAFDPFNNNHLFSCSTDGHVKLWDIPRDGFIVDSFDPLIIMSSGSKCPMRGLAAHHSVNSLMACRGSRNIFLFNATTGQELFTSLENAFAGDIQGMSWSYGGDLLLTTSKDKQLRMWDMRLPQLSAQIACVEAHAGIKNSRVCWLGDTPILATVGHGSNQDREICVWDSRSLSAPLKRERIDSSTGMLMPFFDSDNNLLILAGRGDATVRLYEGTGGNSQLCPISNSPVGEVIRGAALLSKQANDLMGCEVLRLLKLTDNNITPVSFVVPRKEKRKYHDDLFPPTTNEAPFAADVEGWQRGDITVPNKVELAAPSGASKAESAASTACDRELSAAATESNDCATVTSDSNSARIAASLTSALKFRHMYGVENTKANTFYNLATATATSDNPLIACSDQYWAIPYQGGGGPVFVSALDSFGKVEPACAVVNGHRFPVQDIAFSPFHSNIMATCSSDCTVKIWSLPSSGKMTANMTESDALVNLTSHTHCVRTCAFHPLVTDFLVTTSQDMTVRYFDVTAGAEVGRINLGLSDGALVSSLSFNYDGSLFALACKDRVIRIADPRASALVLSTPTESVLGRNLRSTWCTDALSCGVVLSVSSASSGMRQIHLWDPRSLREPICQRSIDNASGQLYPMYDEDTKVCFMCGKGDTIIRCYELNMLLTSGDEEGGGGSLTASCEKSSEFQSGRDPITGACLLPKRVCNVANVEAARLLKLAVDAVTPISFLVPRADHLKQYFQDDIFPATRSKTSLVTVQEWLEVASLQDLPAPLLSSLQPTGMTNVSEKPAETPTKSKVASFREDINKAEEETKQREDTFVKLQNLAIQRSKYHPNASGGSGGHGFKVDAAPLAQDEVAEEEWDD